MGRFISHDWVGSTRTYRGIYRLHSPYDHGGGGISQTRHREMELMLPIPDRKFTARYSSKLASEGSLPCHGAFAPDHNTTPVKDES